MVFASASRLEVVHDPKTCGSGLEEGRPSAIKSRGAKTAPNVAILLARIS
jgi:hypothetical protein